MAQFQLNDLFVTNFEEEDRVFRLGMFVLITLLVVTFGIFVQFPDEHPAEVYAIMLLFAVVILAFEYRGHQIIQAQFLGKLPNFLIGIIAGTIVGYVFVSSPQFIIGIPERLAVAESNLAVLLAFANQLNFFYVVIVAAIAETVFFRGVIYPLVSSQLQNPIIAAILTNAAFGLYHWAAYGGNESFIIGAFVFGMIGTIGNSVFKSLGFELAAHGLNNFIALTRVAGV